MARVEIQDAIKLRSQVQDELDLSMKMKEVVKAPGRWDKPSIVISVLMLVLSALIISIWSSVLIIWVIVTFILYSFNYIIFFLPISRHPGEKKVRKEPSPKRPLKGPLRYLLSKKRKFALEVGATMFLVGMVPLARSFFVLFGIGLIFTIYYGVIQSVLPMDLTIGLMAQIVVIMGYFVLVIMVNPQTQGFTRIARSFKFRILSSRSKGSPAYIWAIAVSGVIIVIISFVAIGAILLPGRTMNSLIDFFETNGSIPLLLVLAILMAEFYIMRTVQSQGSRRMALALIEKKIMDLRTACLEPLDALINGAETHNLSYVDSTEYENVLYAYYPLAVYDVVETNVFGYSPVFLVIPKIDLLLDEEALKYVGMPHDLDGKPIIEGR